jgi:hypothetical protein
MSSLFSINKSSKNKIDCKCGSTFSKGDKSTHTKSEHHQRYMNTPIGEEFKFYWCGSRPSRYKTKYTTGPQVVIIRTECDEDMKKSEETLIIQFYRLETSKVDFKW